MTIREREIITTTSSTRLRREENEKLSSISMLINRDIKRGIYLYREGVKNKDL